MGWRVGLFAVLSFGFPLIIYALMEASKCRGQGGACGAVALVGSFYLRPVIALGFLALMIGPPVARMRALGLPGILGIIVPLLLATDRQFLLVLGAHWSFGFVLGVLSIRIPMYLVLTLVLIAAMALVREPLSDDDSLWQRHGRFGQATLVGLAMVAFLALLLNVFSLGSLASLLNGGVPITPGHIGLMRVWATTRDIGSILAAAVALALIVFVILDRYAKQGGSSGTPDAGDPSSAVAPGPVSRPPPGPGGSFGRRVQPP